MGEWQGPQTEVGGSVGDTAETEFDGMDCLMDHYFTEVKL